MTTEDRAEVEDFAQQSLQFLLRAIAIDLHGNATWHRYVATLRGNDYRRARFLNDQAISADVESVAALVEILAPLTE